MIKPTRKHEEREALAKLVEPWADHHGDLPEYDHPLACVFDSGVEYAVNLLAKTLGVDDWQRCDGTEEYDGDLGGTLFNIVLAALPKDEHGDDIHPSELPAVVTRAQLASLIPTGSAEPEIPVGDLKEVERLTIQLMQDAADKPGMSIGDWVTHRMKDAADKALGTDAARAYRAKVASQSGGDALREALKPFALVADWWEGTRVADDVVFWRGVSGGTGEVLTLTHADLRRARSALTHPTTTAADKAGGMTLANVIVKARNTLRVVESTLECNADDERRWRETIEWLEKLA